MSLGTSCISRRLPRPDTAIGPVSAPFHFYSAPCSRLSTFVKWEGMFSMRRSRPRKRLTKIILTAVLIGLAVVWIYPFILTVFTSLKTQDDVLNDPFGFPPHLTLDAYSTVWSVLDFGQL